LEEAKAIRREFIIWNRKRHYPCLQSVGIFSFNFQRSFGLGRGTVCVFGPLKFFVENSLFGIGRGTVRVFGPLKFFVESSLFEIGRGAVCTCKPLVFYFLEEVWIRELEEAKAIRREFIIWNRTRHCLCLRSAKVFCREFTI